MVERLAVLTMPKQEKLVVLQADVPESFRKKFKLTAMSRDMTMGELIIHLAKKHLEEFKDDNEL